MRWSLRGGIWRRKQMVQDVPFSAKVGHLERWSRATAECGRRHCTVDLAVKERPSMAVPSVTRASQELPKQTAFIRK